MEKFLVTGMSCAACQARVEKAVSGVTGVKSVSVSLLTNSMGVEGDFDNEEVIRAVVDAGYGASLMGANNVGENSQEEDSNYSETEEISRMLEDHETPKLKRRLVLSILFLIPLMYVSMGHMMFGFPLPPFMVTSSEGTTMLISGLVQMVLCLVVMFINRKFFVSGFKGLIHRSPNMDTLIALGSGASFIYSVPQLFIDPMSGLYFESAAMILVFITIGKTLEAFSKGKTTDALKSLIALAPQEATLLVDGSEVRLPVSKVKVGDVFVVKPGEKVPVDGVIIEGTSAINESYLTGESMPVDKTSGDEVLAATINQAGFIKCEATKVGKDTSISKVIKLVADNASTKAPVAKLADRISGVFVPAVIALSIVTLIVWLLLGREFGYALSRGISVLVVSCPCALGLATPVAIMVGNGVGARHGILFKTAEALQETSKVDVIALDKTGTITEGEPSVTGVFPIGVVEEELISWAYSLELKSEHPLAKAITVYAKDKGAVIYETTDFEALPGNGLKAKINGRNVVGGSIEFISKVASNIEEVTAISNEYASEGHTPVAFAVDGVVIGVITIADRIKEDSKLAIAKLQEMGLRVVMLTGDNKVTAKSIADKVGAKEVIAEVKPEGKHEAIVDLSKNSKVMMVGDGINDAPALTSSHVGVAIGAGSDVAIESAGVVLMKSNLMDIVDAIRLSKLTYKVIVENLFWALFYNVLLIPVAAGLYVKFGLQMEPMYGAMAMSISSVFVVLNALRINLFKGSSSSSKTPLNKDYDLKIYTKGLMCNHCEATVKKALEELSEVDSANPNYKTNEITVKLNSNVDDNVLKDVIKSKGYKVKKIKHG